MPVTTNLKRSFVVWNALYLVITLGLGIWGAYDYWVTIPNREIAADRYVCHRNPKSPRSVLAKASVWFFLTLRKPQGC